VLRGHEDLPGSITDWVFPAGRRGVVQRLTEHN
jgi:hypothetical protein